MPMAKEQKLVTLHGTSEADDHCWGTFIGRKDVESDAVQLRDISHGDLGKPGLEDPRELFRAAHTWAKKNGFVGAYPTFIVDGRGFGSKLRLICLGAKIAVERDVPASQLNQPEEHGFVHFHGVFHRHDREFVTGYPTCHERTENGQTIYGTVTLRRFAAYHTRIFAHDLPGVDFHDLITRIAALQKMAETRGYVGCIPVSWTSSEPNLLRRFNHDNPLPHLLDKEGWRIASQTAFAPQVDGKGVVHYVQTVLLERGG
jgi:hypothetical protein